MTLERRAWLATCAVVGLASLALGFLPPPDTRADWFAHVGAPVVLAALVLALVSAALALTRAMRPLRAATTRADAIAILLLSCAYLFAYAQIAPTMRVQADEAMLVGTSLGLSLYGQPIVPLSGHFDVAHTLVPGLVEIDKRGLLLPLLLERLHALFGFSPRHGLALDALGGYAAMLLAFLGLRQTRSAAAAGFGAATLLALPLFVWLAASSGLETLNLAILLLMWNVARAAERTGEAAYAVLLAALAPLAAQLRYESVLAGAIAFAFALALLARNDLSRSRSRWLLVVVPLLFLPFAWQRAIPFQHRLEFVGASSAFGLVQFGTNAKHAIEFLLAPTSGMPVGRALVALAAVGAVAAWRFRRERILRADALAIVALATMLVTILAYAWGDLRSAATARYGLPAFALLGLLGAGAIEALPRMRAGVAVGLAGVLFAMALPALRSDEMYRGLPLGVTQNTVLEFARAQPCRPLIVYAFPTFFVVHGYSALSAGELEAGWAQVLDWRREGAVDDVWAVQSFDRATGAPARLHALPAGFEATPIADLAPTSLTAVRLLRLDRPDAPFGSRCALAR